MAEQGKKNYKMLYIGIAAIVVVAVAYFIIKGSSGGGVTYGQPVTSAEMSSFYSIANNNTLAQSVGISAYEGLSPSSFSHPNLTILTENGKPELLYVGAEYCPYCAATRWALIIALTRFGNFTGLEYMASSATDTDPNTPTFTFVNASYSSSIIAFKTVEIEDRFEKPLQPINGTSAKLYYKYSQGIPFLDFGNKTIQSGSIIDPGILSGMSHAAILSQLTKPNSQISEQEIGAANIYTAEICTMLNNSAAVCSQNYVKQAQAALLG